MSPSTGKVKRSEGQKIRGTEDQRDKIRGTGTWGMRDKFIYHVMIRGINRQDIFEAPEDYRKFIETLASLREVVSEDMQTKNCTCHIYAYCIMPNHVHILIHEKGWTISQCVKYIAYIYVRYYNKKYGRIGHLLQDRFKSEPCNDSDYFIVLMRYIQQNPVKAMFLNYLVKQCGKYRFEVYHKSLHPSNI